MRDLIEKAVDSYIENLNNLNTDEITHYTFYDDSTEFINFLKDDFIYELNELKKEFILEEKEYILITGATGYLGNHLLKKIIDRYPNQKILIVTRKSLPSINENIEFITESMLNILNSSYIKNVKQIIHLAAYVKHDNTPEIWNESYSINIKSSIMMYFLAYLNDCKMIYLSTSGTIAFHSDSVSKNNMPYYKTKQYVEDIFVNINNKFKISLIILRPSMMLGPKINLFGLNDIYERNIINKIKNHKILFNANGVANFIDVRYVSEMCFKIMMTNFKEGIHYFNLLGYNMVMSDFFRKVSEINGWTRYYIPEYMAFVLTYLKVIKYTEYCMSKIGWYYADSVENEFIDICKSEHEFLNIDYCSEYPMNETLKWYD